MVALSGAAQAPLVNRGGGMIFDNTRNITWLADMNVVFRYKGFRFFFYSNEGNPREPVHVHALGQQ